MPTSSNGTCVMNIARVTKDKILQTLSEYVCNKKQIWVLTLTLPLCYSIVLGSKVLSGEKLTNCI